jgi:hypothetical protein
MSGRAHKIELRGKENVPKGKGCGPCAPDGSKEDYQGMYSRAASAAKSGGGKGKDGESGSEILDYQEPYLQENKHRSRGSL